MSQKTPPTYSPPSPPTLQTAGQLYGSAQDFYNNNGYGGLLTAQQTALTNANNPNYYSSFQPTSFENAMGNQYFQNVWPDEAATIRNQMSMSGMAYSPALAETLGRAQGGLETQIGSYLSDQANNRATGAINAGLGISPGSLLTPFVQTGENQSNAQAGLQYSYQQALAQQQYQQQMAKYQQQNALASTLGMISPIGGQIYGGETGTSGSAFGGTASTMSQLTPLMLSGMMSGAGGMPGGSNIGQSSVPGFGGGVSNTWNNNGGVSGAMSAMSGYGG